MKKLLFLLVLSLCHFNVLGQQSLYDEIEKLYFDIDIQKLSESRVLDSRFEWEVFDIPTNDSAKTEKECYTYYDTYPLVDYKLVNGELGVIIKNESILTDITPQKDKGILTTIKLSQRLQFQTQEEVIAAYSSLSSGYEKLGSQISESTDVNDNNVSHTNKVIHIYDDSEQLIRLTFMYPSPDEKHGCRLFISCTYEKRY